MDELVAWQTWSARFAPHVEGRYQVDRHEQPDGTVGQLVEAKCTRCGAVYQGVCTTGEVRTKISRFAAVHAHRAAF